MAANNPLHIEIDTRKVRRFMDDVHNKGVMKAEAPALNRTIRKVNTRTVKRISRVSGMTQRDIKRLLVLHLARRGQKSAAIVAKTNHRTPNLIRFKARETRRHLSARAFGKSLKYPKGFIGNKGRTAFQRKGDKALPIEPLYGANPVRAFASDKHYPVILRYARITLPIEYNKALAYHLSRIRTR